MLSKTSHTILRLSTQQWWVPGETKLGKSMNSISCRKCAEFSPEEMRPYYREFQYQGCKLDSLLNSWSRGFQTINLYIYIYFTFTFSQYLVIWIFSVIKASHSSHSLQIAQSDTLYKVCWSGNCWWLFIYSILIFLQDLMWVQRWVQIN